jgi:hypothetical protein
MDALRPTDSPGAKVIPPTPELFPSGSWDEAWTGGDLEIPYEAGGAYATVEGKGEIAITVDGNPATQIEIDGPGLYKLTDHPQHEQHTISLRPSKGPRIWSVSFAAGVP